MKRIVLAIPLALLVACGSGSKPAEEPSKPGSSSPSSDGGAGAAAGDAGGDPETCKKNFVADCAKEDPAASAYCGCAWDVARTAYGDSMCGPSNEDLQKIHVKVAGQCSQHFPPELIEKAFMAGCTRKQPEMQQYCACSWTELTKKMPPGEMVVERAKGSEKYQTALKASANACQKLRPATR